MTMFTIGEAAKATGLSKPTISKAIKSGKLTATRDGNTPTSPYQIEASELFRVFPANSKNPSDVSIDLQEDSPKVSSDLQAALEVKIEMLERLLEEQKRTSEVQLDAIKEVLQAERKVNALLTNQLEASKPEQSKGFFKRLFS